MYLDEQHLAGGNPFARAPSQAPAFVPSRRVRLAQLLADPDISTVETLCTTLDISQARLARMCKSVYGETPKKLLRRARFGRMLKALAEHPYAEWRNFIDPHYFDQSHFIRDFRYFLGMPPRAYLALPDDVRAACVLRFGLGLGPRVSG